MRGHLMMKVWSFSQLWRWWGHLHVAWRVIVVIGDVVVHLGLVPVRVAQVVGGHGVRRRQQALHTLQVHI